MKDYTRDDPLTGLCGLPCGLCSMHLGGHCPGCGGGAGHHACALIRCAQAHDAGQFCTGCAQYPCARLDEAEQADSFVTHQAMRRDLDRLAAIGLDAFHAERTARIDLLHTLLDAYNDGRRKTLFCAAAALLELPALQETVDALATQATADMPVKARAALAADQLNRAAAQQGISLRLRKKR